MKKEELKAVYERRKLDIKEYEETVTNLSDFETKLAAKTPPVLLDAITTADLDAYIRTLVAEHKNTTAMFIGMMRYFLVVKRQDLYVQLCKYTGADGVIENIVGRLETSVGKPAVDAVLADHPIPVLGTAPEEYPVFARRFTERIKKVCPRAKLTHVMAGNNHGIPEAAFAEEMKFYDEAPTLVLYLKGLHDRQVATLQKYADEKKIWYEQEIDQKVVDFVQANPEIQSAVLVGDKLYATKIPYDPIRYREETDPRMRRYDACHCPFVRESIKKGDPKIDPDWCLCSAGFEKFGFEILFGKELPVKCLNNALRGDDFCRFEIDLSGIDFKK
jgi:hypothetical protein